MDADFFIITITKSTFPRLSAPVRVPYLSLLNQKQMPPFSICF
jgi:hypothetical protein